MKNKLTFSQKRLLLCLVIVAIFAASYQFIYIRYENLSQDYKLKTEAVKEQMIQRKSDLANEDTLKTQIQDANHQIDAIIKEFPVKITKEDNLIFIEKMEQNLGIDIPSVSVLDNTVFYNTTLPLRNYEGLDMIMNPAASGTADTVGNSSNGNTDNTVSTDSTETADTTVITDSSDTGTATDTTITGDGNTTTANQTMTGVISSISINFQITEEQFIRLVKYIENYPERTSIASTSLSYDSTSGELMGNMTINRYMLTGSGKEYKEPDIGNISIGTDNLFGTSAK